MMKFLNYLSFAAIVAVVVSSCTKEPSDTSVLVTGVSLNKTSLPMNKGELVTLVPTITPENATNKSVTWKSDNEKIATVSAEGVVKAVRAGKATVTATTVDGGKTATCTIDVAEIIGAVDLGLSVLWHQCNIGATKPEEYGTYFAWGDVTGQTRNGSSWSGGGFSTYPKYEVDSNNNLKPEYDAAHVLLGGTWRMPTKKECQELIDNCTVTWTSNYNDTGVSGRIFTSNKEGYTDKFIFLPAAGYGFYSVLGGNGSEGNYWSSTFYYDYSAWFLFFSSGKRITDYFERNYGYSIRPVSEL